MEREEFDVIVEAVERLHEYYTRSRCPFILDERVVEPSEYVSGRKRKMVLGSLSRL